MAVMMTLTLVLGTVVPVVLQTRPSRHVGKRTVSVLRKSSGTMVVSPSLTRMVCRLNPATNIPMTNNSPYRFSSVRAIFCFQKKFS